MDRVEIIRQRMVNIVDAASVNIRDDSHFHAGHAGAASGGGHYAIKVISDKFKGLSIIERHRMVYSALQDLMPNEIHALSIETHTTEEVQ